VTQHGKTKSQCNILTEKRHVLSGNVPVGEFISFLDLTELTLSVFEIPQQNTFEAHERGYS